MWTVVWTHGRDDGGDGAEDVLRDLMVQMSEEQLAQVMKWRIYVRWP